MKKKLSKRLCSLVLSAVMVLSMSATTFAETNVSAPYNMVVLEDTTEITVVETSDNEYIYKTTHDKVANTIQLTVTDIDTGLVKAGDELAIPTLKVDRSTLVPSAATLEENTFTNYEYTKTYGTPNKWQLRRPGSNIFSWVYFDTYQTTSNASYLSNFKKAVDSINTLEGAIVGAGGLAALSYCATAASGAGAILTGGVLTPAAWGSIVASAGLSTAYVATCMSYDSACKDAYDAYWETYYSSNIL